MRQVLQSATIISKCDSTDHLLYRLRFGKVIFFHAVCMVRLQMFPKECSKKTVDFYQYILQVIPTL